MCQFYQIGFKKVLAAINFFMLSDLLINDRICDRPDYDVIIMGQTFAFTILDYKSRPINGESLKSLNLQSLGL